MRINSYIKNAMFYKAINSKSSNRKSGLFNGAVRNDTVVFSKKASEQLKSGTSQNRKIDGSIKLSSYLQKVDEKNKKAIENSGNSIKAQVHYNDESSAYEKVLNDKYRRLAAVAKSYESPEQYITDKYFNKSSSAYVSDLTETERRVAFNYEIQMVNTGEISGFDLRDSAFRGLSKSQGLLNKSESDFHRDVVNKQFSNMLQNAGINGAFDFDISIDPYTYAINSKDGKDSIIDNIIKLLENGRNSEQLYKHIIIASLDNNHNNKSITKDGGAKYDLYHQCLNETGIDIRTLEEKNGTYYTKNGRDIIDVYNEAVDNSVKNRTNNMPLNDAANYKKWFKDLVHTVSNKGWNNIDDMFLKIRVTNNGFKELK